MTKLDNRHPGQFQNGDMGIPFMLENTHIHGILVRLGQQGRTIIDRQQIPPVIGGHLAECLALSAAIYGSQKDGAILSFALNGTDKGDVRQLLADVRQTQKLDSKIEGKEMMALRACAMLNDGKASALGQGLLDLLGEEAYLTLTLEPLNPRAEPSQAIIALVAQSLEQAVDDYFHQSAQQMAMCRLSHSFNHEGYKASCLLLKQLPLTHDHEREKAQDDWRRASLLLQSLKNTELNDAQLGHDALLYRLFHEDGVRLFHPKYYVDECTCSRQRMMNMLMGIDKQARKDLIKPQSGLYEVTCQFCNQTHKFHESDLTIH